jgi:hypothetical protein
MNNLAIGNIYKITCNLDPSIYYIGSTFSSIARRFKRHQADYKKQNRDNTAIYEYFDKYGIDNFSVSLIKSYRVIRNHNKDTKHLRAYEQLWINKLNKCCNKIKAFNPLFKIRNREATAKYRANNKETIKATQANYIANNKEKVKAKQAEYNANNKEKIKEYQASYRANNKVKASKANYRANNKEKIKAYQAAYRAKKKLEKEKENTT